MKKNKINFAKKSAKSGAINYAQVLASVEGISQLITIDPIEDGKWGEYKFRYNDTDVHFSIIEAKAFNGFRMANFFDFHEHINKLKDDLDKLIHAFNIRSVGFKCYRVKDKSNIVVFSSEFLFMDNVITKDNLIANLALLTVFPTSFLKVDEK